MSWNAPGSAFGAGAARAAAAEAPLVVLFERDDAIAVPLLSQIRMAGYDVRAARTPVELFDNVQKHPVALILVDLGNAAAGRREFWVALDAQRRGRTIQVLTFRYAAGQSFDTDFEISARALADVEVRSPQEFAQLVEAVRQRVPIHGGGLGNGVPPLGTPLGMGAMPGSNPLNAHANNGYGGNGFAGGAYPPHGMTISPSISTPPSGLGGYTPSMSPSGSDAYPPAGGHFAPPAPTFSPFGSPSPAGLGMPSSASGFGPLQPFSQAPQSPFANPATVNPFAAAEANSPFAQPFTGNPFDAQGSGSPPPAPRNPFVTPAAPYGPGGNGAPGGGHPGLRADGMRLDAYAGPEPMLGSAFGAPDDQGRPPMNGNGSHANLHANNGQAFAGMAGMAGMSAMTGGAGPVVDEWVPPGGDDFPLRDVPPAPPYAPPQGAERRDQAAQRQGGSDFPSYDTMMQAGSRTDDNPRVDDATAPVSAHMQVMQGAVNGRAERALGTVLVEGALLTAQKLDVLKGIQRMLSSVDMDFRLGELALLFKFLSPDQLLAALLVSRGLVSPQQIAALGRIKQELGGSGMDYDLETLLIMFHILPAEDLRRLRAELA